MPDTGYFRDEMILTSMIRVHDLKDNMKLVGRYDFPQEGQKRRHLRSENGGFSNETAHLHKLGDKAVGFCRTPKLSLFGEKKNILGRSIVVHKNPDDLGKGGFEDSLETGHSGPRLDCAVIGRDS